MLKIKRGTIENVLLSKNKKKNLAAIRDLLDIQEIKDNVITTSYKNKYYIKVSPKNINIMQQNVLFGIIDKFKYCCNVAEEFEILVCDKTERIEKNKEYIIGLYEKSTNPVYKEILRQEIKYFEKLQSSSGASRDFYIVVNFKDYDREKDKLHRIVQCLKDENFEVDECNLADLQNMLQVYFERNFANKEVSDPLEIASFMDLITPSILKFNTDHYIFGNTCRRVFAIKNYPMETEKLALLRKFGENRNITLKIYARTMTRKEFGNVMESSINKNTSDAMDYKFMKQTKAEQQIDIEKKLANYLNSNQDEKMFSVSIFVEIIAGSRQELDEISDSVISSLDGISYDNLFLQQKLGFIAVHPAGINLFTEFERHMPSSSLSNLYPFSYSGMIDKEGQPIGYDRHGGQIILNIDKRSKKHTNSCALVLGNGGEGKSHLLKELITNMRLKGTDVIVLDPEREYDELTVKLEGTYIELLSGNYIINLLEPKKFVDAPSNDSKEEDNEDEVKTFTKKTVLAQHISYLKDFFLVYKSFDEQLIDIIEIMLEKTYLRFNIDYNTDVSKIESNKFPILSDLYKTLDNEYNNFGNYDDDTKPLYTLDMLRDLMLGLRSICTGADSKYFNGHTNIKNYEFVTFEVKALLDASINLKNAMLFNIFSYMANKLLVSGATYLCIDELYLFLDNPVLIKYVRNFVKRCRKKDSGVIMLSQNIEDFLQQHVAELTKPLFAIPTYKFLFHPGTVSKEDYMRALNLTESEYRIIQSPNQGNCLFCAGSDRYNLRVYAPEYKTSLFGKGGGR
jgi:type IV secretory pathway VirB4 component